MARKRKTDNRIPIPSDPNRGPFQIRYLCSDPQTYRIQHKFSRIVQDRPVDPPADIECPTCRGGKMLTGAYVRIMSVSEGENRRMQSSMETRLNDDLDSVLTDSNASAD